MRKLKLLLAACALLGSATMSWADAGDYLDGWTEVTTLPTSSSELANYYYVFVATEADLMVAEEINSTQETQLSTVYRTPTSPLTCKRVVWTLEYDETYKWGIRNLGYNTHLLQTRENAPWRIQAAWETAQSQWTQWTLSYGDGSWTVQNGLYPTYSDADCYWGPWTDKAFTNGQVLAGNKAGDNIGHFKIYQILRTTYNTMVTNKVVTNTYITNPSFEANGSTIAETSTASSASGWSFDWSGNNNSNAVNGIATKGTKYGSIGDNVEASDGTYFMAIRLRWDEKTYTANTSQILTLPKGSYLLNIDYRAWTKQSSATLTFAALAEGGTLSTTNGTVITGASSFNDVGFETLNLPFTTSTSSVTIKFTLNGKQNTQAIYDNVNLIYTANYTEALQAALDQANALYTRSNDADLNTAISTAQSVLDGATNLVGYQETIDNAVTNLNSAIATAYSKVSFASGEDITFLIANAGFESSTPVSGAGVVTTIKDAYSNNTFLGNLQAVGGWYIAENGDNHAGGIYTYGGTPWLGGSGYTAPDSDPEGNAGKALGIVAVWTATSQYKQNVTLPAGRYEITIPIYNKTGGTTAFDRNLFGFIEDGGTEHLATAKTYAVNEWTTETISFDLNSETSGYLSLGYKAVNSGSGNMPHLFIDGIKITFTDAANAYAATKTAAQETYDAAAYANIKVCTTSTERIALYNLLNPATAPSTVAEYFTAIDNINAAVATFTAAKDGYDEYAEANAIATTVGADAVTAPTTASEAVTRAHELNVNIDTKVSATYRYDVTAAYVGSWTGSIGTKSGQHWSDGSTSYLDNYGSGTISNTQTLSLSAGEYVLKLAGRGSSDATAVTMTANGQTVHFARKGDSGLGIDKNGAANFTEADDTYCNSNNGRGWEWRFIPISLDEATDVTVTLTIERSSTTWASFSDFTILQNDASAVAADYTALSDAVTSAEARTLGFDEGEYAPYTNIDILTKLAAAKVIDSEEDHSKTYINDLTATLNSDDSWNANATEVNAVSSELFSGVEYGTAGWTRSVGWNNVGGDASYSIPAGTMTYGTGAYHEMPLKGNTVYKLIVGHRRWDSGNADNGGTVSVLNESSEGLAATSYSGTSSETLQNEQFFFRTGADDANYIFSISAASGRLTFGNVSIMKAVASTTTISEDDNAAPAYDYANVTLTRTLSASNWNTFSVPFDMAIPEGWTVKEFDSATDNVISFKNATTIVAGKPYLVKPTANVVNPTYNGVIVQNTEGTTDGTGDYKFAAQIYNKALATDGTIAYLATDGTVKKLTSGSIKGLRAYFIIPAGASGARIAFIDGDETTGISEMKSLPVSNDTIYDLNGRRVQNMSKGIYVVNGKKVVK